jgi:hypothetical protein
MKALSTWLLVTILFVASCKKNDNLNHPHMNGDVYLIKTITFNISGDSYSANFAYDSQNRVSEFHFSYSRETYSYTYNSNNMLAQANIYDSGTLKFIEKFRYAADSVLVQQYAADGVTKYVSYGFLISNNHVAKLLGPDSYESDYTRDSNGNITHFASAQGNIETTQDYQYDSNPSPLARIGISNLHLLFLTAMYTQDSPNNIVSHTYLNQPYIYNYLPNGLPSSADTGNGLSMKFEYIGQ